MKSFRRLLSWYHQEKYGGTCVECKGQGHIPIEKYKTKMCVKCKGLGIIKS